MHAARHLWRPFPEPRTAPNLFTMSNRKVAAHRSRPYIMHLSPGKWVQITCDGRTNCRIGCGVRILMVAVLVPVCSVAAGDERLAVPARLTQVNACFRQIIRSYTDNLSTFGWFPQWSPQTVLLVNANSECCVWIVDCPRTAHSAQPRSCETHVFGLSLTCRPQCPAETVRLSFVLTRPRRPFLFRRQIR